MSDSESESEELIIIGNDPPKPKIRERQISIPFGFRNENRSPDLGLDSEDETERPDDTVKKKRKIKSIIQKIPKIPKLNLHTIKSPRNTLSQLPLPYHSRKHSETLETDDGILFGVKSKHMRAQMNLTILTFGVTAFISVGILVFAILMLSIKGNKHLTETEYITYVSLILTIGSAWLPSPTTLLKKQIKISHKFLQ